MPHCTSIVRYMPDLSYSNKHLFRSMAYAMAGSHLANLEVVQNGLDDWFNANTLYKLFHVFLFCSILPNIGRMTTLSTVHCNATRMTTCV